MKKSYHCVFGTNIDVGHLCQILYDNFDMEFTPHDSRYVGLYLKYSGLFADKIVIKENKSDPAGARANERLHEYATLICLDNFTGKNSDKLSKTNYLKSNFNKIPGIFMLEEKIFEE